MNLDREVHAIHNVLLSPILLNEEANTLSEVQPRRVGSFNVGRAADLKGGEAPYVFQMLKSREQTRAEGPAL